MFDDKAKFNVMDTILSQTYPVVYGQLHPQLRSDILTSVINGEDVKAKFIGAPSDSATLNFMDWIQIVGSGATLISVGLQMYQIAIEQGKSKLEARRKACDAVEQHDLATRIKIKHREVLIREFESVLEHETWHKTS